jgi:hypothetical protein
MKYLKRTCFYVIVLLSTTTMIEGCQSNETATADSILVKSSAAHQVDKIFGKEISFRFREHSYRLYRDSVKYIYTRITADSIEDELHSIDGFSRRINGKPVKVVDSMAAKYSSSVNSVLYFFQLPLVLNDAAARKEYLGTNFIGDSEYHRLKVTFSEEGGGEDFEDEFRYWINTETLEIDYLAYSYLTDGGGIRFREAYNKRRVDGFLVQDYRNYKPASLDISLDSLPSMFESDELQLLSTIEKTDIEVSSR